MPGTQQETVDLFASTTSRRRARCQETVNGRKEQRIRHSEQVECSRG